MYSCRFSKYSQTLVDDASREAAIVIRYLTCWVILSGWGLGYTYGRTYEYTIKYTFTEDIREKLKAV